MPSDYTEVLVSPEESEDGGENRDNSARPLFRGRLKEYRNSSPDDAFGIYRHVGGR
jgi:hypothetical protein